MGRLERSLREMLQLISSEAGRSEAWQRLQGMIRDPGATLDSLIIHGQDKEAGAATRVHFILPALGTCLVALIRLEPLGILTRAMADLIAVAFLPNLLAWALPKLLLLVDQVGTSNYRRWRVYCAHALLPALAFAFLARVALLLSGWLATALLLLGLGFSTRTFVAAHDEWLDLPEEGKLSGAALYLAALTSFSLGALLLLNAGLLARSG